MMVSEQGVGQNTYILHYVWWFFTFCILKEATVSWPVADIVPVDIDADVRLVVDVIFFAVILLPFINGNHLLMMLLLCYFL